MGRVVSVGECIVELRGSAQTAFDLRFAGQAFELALLMRRDLPASWSVDFFTALGDDCYSQRIVEQLAAGGVGIGSILKVPGRTVGLCVTEAPPEGPLTTNWRSQSAARLMAEDMGALDSAFAGADLIYVSGAAFAILSPRARGRLLKSLHRVRTEGTRIAFAPHEWPGLWTSRRVMGSAINSISMIADIVITSRAAEANLFGDDAAPLIARRYAEWGVQEVFVRIDDIHAYVGGDGEIGAFVLDRSVQTDGTGATYLARRMLAGSSAGAVAAISRREGQA